MAASVTMPASVTELPPAWGDRGTAKPAPLSPRWWVNRLHARLLDRCDDIARYTSYYAGDHPLPWIAEQAQAEFRRILRMTRSNYMGLVVDAPVQRMKVEGFRIGGGSEGDAEAWRVWQANNLDRRSKQAFATAFTTGCAYWLVAPPQGGTNTPIVTVEHPSQAIIEYVPGSDTQRAAGLKVWANDWLGQIEATLYLPGWIYKIQAPKPSQGVRSAPQWEPRRVVGETWPARNPLAVVPLVEMPNRPDLLLGGISELVDVTDIQDRVNKTIADRLMTQDFGAFPQKWVAGWDVETDPTTGQPRQTVDVGRNRLIQAEDASTKFGQWDAAPLDPYSAAKREDVKDIASRTQTPAQYLLGELTNVNGETLKAAESGLVSKIYDRREPFADAMEEVVRLSFRAVGDDRANDMGAETIWRNPEFRTEGELVDALTKMATLGVPREALWERWGASQEEIRRWQAAQIRTAALATLQNPAQQPPNLLIGP